MRNYNSYLYFLLISLCMSPSWASEKPALQPQVKFAKNTGKISHRLLIEQDKNQAITRSKSRDTKKTQILLDVILSDYHDELEQKFNSAGFLVQALSEKYLRASLLMTDGASLVELGRWPEIQYVQKELGSIRKLGSADSRAPVALKSNLISGQPYNLTGSGQKIGILSDSFSHTSGMRDGNTVPAKCAAGVLKNSKAQDSGDLPVEVEIRKDDTRNCAVGVADSGGSDEGAAMAELVYDIAPDAEIVFSTVGASLVSFAMAIDDLCTPVEQGGAGATVVVDDIIFVQQLMYQDDIVSQAAQGCVDAGIPYFSAAGNDADTAFNMVYNDVSSIDRSPDSTTVDGNDFHGWGITHIRVRHLKIDVPAGASFSAILQWNQPALSNPTNIANPPLIDLDLLLLSDQNVPAIDNSNILDLSIEDQGALLESADPIEYIEYENTTSFEKTVYLAIDHWSGNKEFIPQDEQTKLEFRLVFYTSGELRFPGNSQPSASTMYGHSNAAGVVSVAAVPWYESDDFGKAGGLTAEIDPEPFTAKGGSLNKYFANDGSYLEQTVIVPTLASIDGNNTSFFGDHIEAINFFGENDGSPNFFGTSAAAPNAAAVAALLLEKQAATPEQLTKILTCSAEDVKGERAKAGMDYVTGVGLIDAQQAISEIIQPSTASQLLPLSNRTVISGTNVNLDLLLADSSRLITSSQWSQRANLGVQGSIVKEPGGIRFITPRSSSVIQLDVKAYDQCGFEYRDSVTITVDGKPTARGRVEGVLRQGETITLTAADSFDVEGGLHYRWYEESTSNFNLRNAQAVEASFVAVKSGSYLFRLTVIDNQGLSDSEIVEVNIAIGGGSGSKSGGALFYALIALWFMSLLVRRKPKTNF